MVRKGYRNLGVPDELLRTVAELIGVARLGYRSASEFAIEAVREKVTRVERNLGLRAQLRPPPANTGGARDA